MTSPIDIGILTVIPAEIEATFAVFDVDKSQNCEQYGPLQFWRTTKVSSLDHRVLHIAISFVAGTAGNIESAITSTLMLRELRPRLMCLVGIAAGAEKKTKIGDVVVPDIVHDVTITVRKGEITQPRRRSCDIDGRLQQLLKLHPLQTETLKSRLSPPESLYATLANNAQALGLTANDIARNPAVRDGSLVSGNTLLRDSQYFPDFHSSSDERCRAAEMEAAGFVRSCNIAGCPWMIFRGVSDFGDERKDDSFQSYAAHNAAVVLREFIEGHWQIETFPRVGSDQEKLLTDTLEQSMSEEYERGNAAYVIEIGSFLSRPLWLSGKLDLRKRIGEFVEDAAATCGRDTERARSLIDDIGWTCAALKDYSRARKVIGDGLRLAAEAQNWYLCAKASRHLASIARQTGNPEECNLRLTQAESYASRIDDTAERNEMVVSLLVSKAKFLSAEKKYNEAVSLLEQAREQYQELEDSLREVKVYHPLGMAHLGLGEHDTAIRIWAEGHEFALRCARRNEALINAEAVSIVLGDMGKAEQAKEWARKALRLSVDLGDFALSPRVVSLASGVSNGASY